MGKVARANIITQASVACAVLLGFVALQACRDPTQLELDMTTNAECTDVGTTEITVGNLVEIETSPPTATKNGCDARGVIGTVVLTPAGSKDGAVSFRVVTGIRQGADQCKPPDYAGCIVARRSMHYIAHTPLKINVYMDLACKDVPCGATDTCVGGQCVPAQVNDPGACAHPGGCGEGVLPEAGAQDGSGDAGGNDASADADARAKPTDGAATCPPNQTLCTDAGPPYCANPKSDTANCGGCGSTCGAGKTCSNGSCVITCQPNEILCTPDAGSPYCADKMNDVKSCGSCFNACGQGKTCVSGTCAITCQPYETLCPGGGNPYCANLNTDEANCGTCGRNCLLLRCSNGNCL